jgi:hypothetical protein
MPYVAPLLIVASFSNETVTARAQSWPIGQDRGQFPISDWTIAELLTPDRRLAEAGPVLGIPARLPA